MPSTDVSTVKRTEGLRAGSAAAISYLKHSRPVNRNSNWGKHVERAGKHDFSYPCSPLCLPFHPSSSLFLVFSSRSSSAQYTSARQIEIRRRGRSMHKRILMSGFLVAMMLREFAKISNAPSSPTFLPSFLIYSSHLDGSSGCFYLCIIFFFFFFSRKTATWKIKRGSGGCHSETCLKRFVLFEAFERV